LTKTPPKKVLVFCAVYNEEPYIERTARSVLSQTYESFEMVISDNHSTDNSRKILAGIDDPRIKVISPPSHLSSIEHGKWLSDYIIQNYPNLEYSIFVGGHDLWNENYLETLVAAQLQGPNIALIYTDTYEIDSKDRVLKKFPNNICSVDLPRPIRPISILTTLTHNIAFGGLWRESLRRKVMQSLPICAGVDHLLVARLSLLGDVLHANGSSMYLRRAKGKADLDVYFRKHFGLTRNDTINGVLNFIEQIEFALKIQEEAVNGEEPFYSCEALRSLKLATVLTYTIRYIENLRFFENGWTTFLDSSEFNTLVVEHGLDKYKVKDLLRDRIYARAKNNVKAERKIHDI